MRPFDYASPKSTDQVVHLLAGNWEQTAVLAGGTDLLSLMKDDVVAPKRVVNIKQVKDLAGVTAGARGLRMGALTTLGARLVGEAEWEAAEASEAAEPNGPRPRNGRFAANLNAPMDLFCV